MPAIVLTVPGNKWETYKRYFLMIHPNQTLDSNNVMTDDEWVRHRIFLFARGAYEKGLCQEHEELNGPVFDTEMIV